MTSWQCRRQRAALVDYAAGGLVDAAQASVERHLVQCGACREAVATLQQLPAQLGELELADPGEEFWLQQRQAIMRAVRNVPEPRRGFGAWFGSKWDQSHVAWRLPLAATASLFLALSIYRFGLVGRHVTKITSPPAVSSLDDESLVELRDVVSVVAPRDESVANGYQDEDLLTSLPLSDLIGSSGGGAGTIAADADGSTADPADSAGDDLS